MNLLALNIVLLPFFPLFLWLLYRQPMLALAASIGTYTLARQFDWTLPAYPSGTWSLNPFAWQILFGLGAWCGFGGAQRIEKFLRSRTVLLLSIAYLAGAPVISWQLPQIESPAPAWVPGIFERQDKTNFDEFRFVYFLALAVLASRLVPHNWTGLRSKIFRPAILCGQHPLGILCWAIFLSFLTGFEADLSDGTLLSRLLISSLCIIGMAAVSALLPSDDTQQVSITSTRKLTLTRK